MSSCLACARAGCGGNQRKKGPLACIFKSDHHGRRFSVAHPFAFVPGPPPPPQSFAIRLLGRGLLGYKLTYSLGVHLEEKVRVSRNLGIGA